MTALPHLFGRHAATLAIVAVALAAGRAAAGPASASAPAPADYVVLGQGKLDPAGTGAFSIAVIGNPPGGPKDNDADVLKFAEALNAAGVDVVIGTGDASGLWYSHGIPKLNCPFLNAIGNHDGRTVPQVHKARRFSFVHKGVHLIGFDDQITNGDWAEEIQWFKRELQKPARWRLAFKHEPNRFADDLWMAEIHPLLVKNNTVAAFASHHGEYAWWELDGLRYVANRAMDNRGLNYSFIKVDVPADGRPTCTLMADGKPMPEDFARELSDRQEAMAMASMSNMVAHIAAIEPGAKEPYKLTFPLWNPSRTQETRALWTWRVDNSVLARIKPAQAELVIPPGGHADAEFTIDVSDPELAPLGFQVSLTTAGTASRSVAGQVLTARRAEYLSADPAGAVPESARLRISQKRQVVQGPADAWKGPEDCSAVATLTWTDKGLLAVADVIDDDVQDKDAVTFHFDLRPDRRGLYGMQKGVFTVTVRPKVAPDQALTMALPKYAPKLKVTQSVKIVEGKGYRVEIDVPADALPEGCAARGGEILFDVSIADSDADQQANTVMFWSAPMIARGANSQLAWGRLTPAK